VSEDGAVVTKMILAPLWESTSTLCSEGSTWQSQDDENTIGAWERTSNSTAGICLVYTTHLLSFRADHLGGAFYLIRW